MKSVTYLIFGSDGRKHGEHTSLQRAAEQVEALQLEHPIWSFEVYEKTLSGPLSLDRSL